MDIVTLGAALNGSAEYVNSHFKGGSNIQIVDNPDGTQTINASGEVSSEDAVARAEIAEMKDGENLDSFGDVETALGDKADTSTTYTKTEVDTALSAKADKSTTYTKTEVDTVLDDKVDKVPGKGLSTNDYTTAEKTKLAGIAEGAEVNEIESIKVNNTTINPDANKVVNITVPTTAADVSALPDTTKYAASLLLTINSSTFVMTGQLKDQNGDDLGTAQTIDLPLESVVVGGSYDSQTKKVVLTLQNGNTIEFSVADLVSGLQTELSASNKLNPAYINYDSTHRAVSDTEKSTWNGKQNAISDLETIRSGAAAGATAVQPVSGKGLSTNDYTNDEKTKLTGIAEGAEVNVQSDWAQTTTTADDYIKNKPSLGTAAALDVAASGNASTSQVVKGNDTRLTDARNAADVSSWAKAANKPSYNGSEIALTGYTEAQSKSNVAATDTTNAAIGKLEYRVETNENNILSVENTSFYTVNLRDMTFYSHGYITPDGKIRTNSSDHAIYTMPVGNIRKIAIKSNVSGTVAYGVIKSKNGDLKQILKTTSTNRIIYYLNDNVSSSDIIYIGWYYYRTNPTNFYTSIDIDKPYINSCEYKHCITKPLTFNEKKIQFFGDSITWGYIDANTRATMPFPESFCNKVNASCVNSGVNGATLSPVSGYTSIYSKIQTDIESTADYIVIAGGINDWQLGADVPSIKKAISNICTYLNSNYSGSVIWVTPINEAGWTPTGTPIISIDSIRKYITEIALVSGQSVVQGGLFPFPNVNDDSTYISTIFVDKLHPTQIGYNLFAQSLETALC